MKQLAIFLIFFQSFGYLFAQNSFTIKGIVVDDNNTPIPYVSIVVKSSKKGTFTNTDGEFSINNLQNKNIELIFSAVSFKTLSLNIDFENQKELYRKVTLQFNIETIDEVVIKGKTKTTKIKEKGFSISAIETQAIKNQSLEINKILDRTPGVRVRSTGGVGSDFDYSLDGMSGNAIRFFIDGIPMDLYGSSFSINNLPVALVDRIDVFKGVVPADLGSDALGGAVNLVTKQNVSNFVEASYSFGSFNTHKAAIHGQWKFESGLTTKLSSFYTYSDNNYKVWGEGVFYADASTGFQVVEFTKDNPAERFNDDFKTISTKVDIGFTDKKWADQFFITLLASDLKKGVQTAQTMSRVFGRVRNNEQTIMPSIIYKKKDFITKGLDVNTFAGYSYTKGVVVDTSFVQFDWRGKVIGRRSSGGEIGYDGRSLFTLKDRLQVYRANATYQLPSNYKLGFNYIYSNLKRSGEDRYSPSYRIPYIEPQNVGSHFMGLSLETTKFNKKFHANVFLKYYKFIATINELVYTTRYEVIKNNKSIPRWGGGFASSYRVSPNFLLKASLEHKATRLPSTLEAIGNGVNIRSNPNIKPEQNFNANLGAILGRFQIGELHGIKIEANTFYRDTEDRLQLVVEDARGFGQYRNIDRISGLGAELGLVYDYKQKLRLNLNGTYLDYRNNLKIDELGRQNIFYRDRVPNDPYLMMNAGIDYTLDHFIQKDSKFFTYFQSSYVHDFFLSWESAAAAENKRTIPSQLVFDTGVSYTFPKKNIVLAFDVSNILNEQVYDNYRLQKPGRAFFIKINYQITN